MSNQFRFNVTNGYSRLIAINCDCSLISPTQWVIEVLLSVIKSQTCLVCVYKYNIMKYAELVLAVCRMQQNRL